LTGPFYQVHATYFLHYLQLEEDTFMDNLADPVSTDEEVADFE
jgi:hypothetical protein